MRHDSKWSHLAEELEYDGLNVKSNPTLKHNETSGCILAEEFRSFRNHLKDDDQCFELEVGVSFRHVVCFPNLWSSM